MLVLWALAAALSATGNNTVATYFVQLGNHSGLSTTVTGSLLSLPLGAVLAFSAGWGWTGLLPAATLRLVADKAENAGDTVQIGIYTGATIAPYTFAALSKAFGLAGAVLIAATAALAAAARRSRTCRRRDYSWSARRATRCRAQREPSIAPRTPIRA